MASLQQWKDYKLTSALLSPPTVQASVLSLLKSERESVLDEVRQTSITQVYTEMCWIIKPLQKRHSGGCSAKTQVMGEEKPAAKQCQTDQRNKVRERGRTGEETDSLM